MAWSWGDGWDLYTAFADAYAGYWDSGAGAPTFVVGRFSGSQALHVTATATTITKSSGQNDAVHHLVVAFRQTAAISGTTLGLYLQLLDATTGQCCVVFRSDGAILLTSGTPGGTVLDTYAGAFPVSNTWYAFEFEIVINNSTGRFRVRKNGNTSDDYDSTAIRNTRVSANNYANKLTIGMQAAVNAHEIDDTFWQSGAATGTFLSDIRCYTRMPASDASVTFSRTAGATNASCVDEPQQNTTTDYVYDSTVNDADFYNIGTIASTPATTIAVTTRGYMQKSDAGSRTAAVQIKSGGTTVASSTLTLTTSGWQWAWRMDLVDPNTSAAWTPAAVNNVTIGPTVIA
jgi:hypothetical protein